jgi:hypothetical protein
METLLLILVPLLLLRRKPTPTNNTGPEFPDVVRPNQMRPGGGGSSQAYSGGTPSGGAKSDDPMKRGGYGNRGMV